MQSDSCRSFAWDARPVSSSILLLWHWRGTSNSFWMWPWKSVRCIKHLVGNPSYANDACWGRGRNQPALVIPLEEEEDLSSLASFHPGNKFWTALHMAAVSMLAIFPSCLKVLFHLPDLKGYPCQYLQHSIPVSRLFLASYTAASSCWWPNWVAPPAEPCGLLYLCVGPCLKQSTERQLGFAFTTIQPVLWNYLPLGNHSLISVFWLDCFGLNTLES